MWSSVTFEVKGFAFMSKNIDPLLSKPIDSCTRNGKTCSGLLEELPDSWENIQLSTTGQMLVQIFLFFALLKIIPYWLFPKPIIAAWEPEHKIFDSWELGSNTDHVIIDTWDCTVYTIEDHQVSLSIYFLDLKWGKVYTRFFLKNLNLYTNVKNWQNFIFTL
jgi:hypothetical protein